jgi:hypothetical protein
MITGQVLSIVAILISWVWWVSFIICVAALVLHQLIWCCRQSRLSLVAAQVVSIIAGLMCIVAGVYFLVARKDVYWCAPFTLMYDDFYSDDYYSNDSNDHCAERAFAIVAFIDAALWFATAGCTMAFMTTGRYARWEASISNKSTGIDDAAESPAPPVALEMGKVDTNEEPSVDATATPVAAEAAEYVPPDIAQAVSESVDV